MICDLRTFSRDSRIAPAARSYPSSWLAHLIALIAFVSAHQTVSGIIVSRRGYRVEVSQGTHHV